MHAHDQIANIHDSLHAAGIPSQGGILCSVTVTKRQMLNAFPPSVHVSGYTTVCSRTSNEASQRKTKQAVYRLNTYRTVTVTANWYQL